MNNSQSSYQPEEKIVSYNRFSEKKSIRNQQSLRRKNNQRARRRQRNSRIFLFAGSVLILFLTVFLFLHLSRSKVIPYPIIQNLKTESNLFDDVSTSLYKLPEALEDYEAKIQTSLSDLLPGYDCTNYHISILYYPSWDEKANLAKLTYSYKQKTALLQVSTTASPAPIELFSEEAKTKIGTAEVYFGYVQSPQTFYAAWEKDHVYYCLSQQKVSHGSFTELVEKILK